MGFFAALKDDLFQNAGNTIPKEELIKLGEELVEESSFPETDPEEETAGLIPEVESAPQLSESQSFEGQMQSLASNEISVLTSGMVIKGDIISEGSAEIHGTVNGNVDVLGKLVVTGRVNGDVKAAELVVGSAKICGEIVSGGEVTIDAGAVIIGNITGRGAVIAGVVKGDIDVMGAVTLEETAMVMGNIKCRSVQISAGAGIEGMCSQCYAEKRPSAFFDDYKV